MKPCCCPSPVHARRFHPQSRRSLAVDFASISVMVPMRSLMELKTVCSTPWAVAVLPSPAMCHFPFQRCATVAASVEWPDVPSGVPECLWKEPATKPPDRYSAAVVSLRYAAIKRASPSVKGGKNRRLAARANAAGRARYRLAGIVVPSTDSGPPHKTAFRHGYSPPCRGQPTIACPSTPPQPRQ